MSTNTVIRPGGATAGLAANAARDRVALRRRGGFTLVEILAVVVILGIASAIIIPQIGTRDDMRAKAAARTLIADLIYCQNLAISTGNPVFLRFDVADSSYRMITAPTSANTATWGTPVSHPIRQTAYITKFGPRSDAATDTGWGLLPQDATVRIQSAVFNGIDTNFQNEFTVGFDAIGAPLVWCYDLNQQNDLNTGTIVVQAGQFTNTVTVSPATGEILVN
jgi:prepilin-type N-terminal cleavage/methylation domain-containing protein